MKSLIAGGLCFVAFALTVVSYVPPAQPVMANEVTTDVAIDRELTRSDGSEEARKAKKKAVRLMVVTTAGCPPCRRLKTLTLIPLLAEGYDVCVFDAKNWEDFAPKVTTYPTMFYYDGYGNILHKDEGFRTVEQVKKWLKK